LAKGKPSAGLSQVLIFKQRIQHSFVKLLKNAADTKYPRSMAKAGMLM
jgi:hypothetical protein